MKKLTYLSFILMLVGSSICTFLGYFGESSWILDLFSHFKLQYAVILSVCFVAFLLLRKIKAILFTLPFLLSNLAETVPIYFGGDNASPRDCFEINSINLLSSNGQLAQVANQIRKENSEILVLQELTELWKVALDSILEEYPYQLSVPREDNFGIGIYSKIKMSTSEESHLSDARLPSILAKFILSSDTINLLATHPLPPIGRFQFESRNDQFQRISKLRESLSGEFVLVGDLNSTSYSTHFKKLIKKTKLKDSRKGYGVLSTWPAGISLLRITLDHCLVSDGLLITNREVGDYLGSDHLPISIQIAVKN